MAKILVAGVYMAGRLNTASHIMDVCASSKQHDVTQRWIALAPRGRGDFSIPGTQMVVVDQAPKFELLSRLFADFADFDYVVLCDDDVELPEHFLDKFLSVGVANDFALFQPARTVDSFTDHPIVQVIPGLSARLTRFVEIGPLTCFRRDGASLLLPATVECGMGWGLDFIWPVVLEKAGLRLGIVDAVPVAHRIRPPAVAYSHAIAQRAMFDLLARNAHLKPDDAFTVLEAYGNA